jgi:thioredoxin 1
MSNLVDLTNNDISPAQQDGLPILLDVWSTTCGPCMMMMPVLVDLAAEFAGKLVIAKVEGSSNMDLVKRFEVRGVPTLILLKDGVEMNRVVGYNTKQQLIDKLGLNA